MTDLIPPQNLDAEQAVLGAMMVDRAMIWPVSAILTTADFYAPHHATIYDVITGLHFEDAPIDKVSVAEELTRRKQLDNVGGLEKLTQLLDAVPTTASAEYYASLVAEKSKLRRMIDAGRTIEKLGWQQPEDVDAAIDQAERLLYALRGRNMPTAIPVQDALRDWYADLERMRNRPSISLPYPTLHYHVGGLQPGWIYVLAGRPNHCKTLMAVDIARSVARSQPVMFGSLEEGVKPIIARAVGHDANIPITRLLTGKATDYDFGKAAGVMGQIAEEKLTFLGRPIFLRELRAIARREKEQHGLSLLVIDHSRKLRDMRVDVRKNMTYLVEDVLDEIKDVAEELQIPVLLLVHLGRGADNRGADGPRTDDVGDSDHYERAAAALFATWLPHRYDAKEPKTKLMCRVLKSKYGAPGDLEFMVDLPYNRIREASQSETSQQLDMAAAT